MRVLRALNLRSSMFSTNNISELLGVLPRVLGLALIGAASIVCGVVVVIVRVLGSTQI